MIKPPPQIGIIVVVWYPIPYSSGYVKIGGPEGTHTQPRRHQRRCFFPVLIRATARAGDKVVERFIYCPMGDKQIKGGKPL